MEFRLLSLGSIPEVMEDHWFMYCDGNSINYIRSWTGTQIFKAYYRQERNGYYRIYFLKINSDKEEYAEYNIFNAKRLFIDLVYGDIISICSQIVYKYKNGEL